MPTNQPNFGNLASEVTKLGDALNKLAGAVGSHMDRTTQAARATTAATAASVTFHQLLSGNLAGALTNFSASLLATLPGLAGIAGEATKMSSSISALVGWLNPEIFQAFGTALQLAVMPILTAMIPLLDVAMGFITKIGIIVEQLAVPLQEFMLALSPIIDILIDVGLSAFTMVANIFVLLAKVAGELLIAFRPVVDYIANVIVGAMGALTQVIRMATPLIAGLFQSILPTIIEWLKYFAQSLVWAAEKVVNGFIWAWNALAGLVNSIADAVSSIIDLPRMTNVGYANFYKEFIEEMNKLAQSGADSRKALAAEANQRKQTALSGMGPKGGLSSLEGVWAKMMNASLGDNPAEREKRRQQVWQQMLLKMGTMEAILQKGAAL